MTISIQLTNYRGVVQEQVLCEASSLDHAYEQANALLRASDLAGQALYLGNVEVLS